MIRMLMQEEKKKGGRTDTFTASAEFTSITDFTFWHAYRACETELTATILQYDGKPINKSMIFL